MSWKRIERYRSMVVCAAAMLLCFISAYGGAVMKAKPFLKWAGGKGQLLEQLDALLPKNLGERKNILYVEPFVGGGAMLFHVLSKYPNIEKAVINDLNTDLIDCYRVVRDSPEDLISELHKLQCGYLDCPDEESRKAMYLEKRDRYNAHESGKIEAAALFIFLNRTCFNGLYRVNSKGKFNVPFGKAVNPQICDEATIREDSRLLQKVELLCGDFEEVGKVVNGIAFFYFDPPYRPLTQTAAFTAYSKDGFDDVQQRRLAEFCRAIDAKGYQWLLSNSDPHNVDPKDMFFETIYRGFEIRRVYASRMINSKTSGRGRITELAIRNYKE